MSWSIAALAVLSASLLVLIWARWGRGSAAGDPASAAPSARASRGIPAGASKDGPDSPPVRSCPVCMSEYAPQNRFCVRDGAPLHDGRLSSPFSQGMICPTCRRGYPGDASFCPEDSDELVPYGLYGAASTTRPPIRLDGNKICPECGVRHAAAHVFCGRDGTELVVVN